MLKGSLPYIISLLISTLVSQPLNETNSTAIKSNSKSNDLGRFLHVTDIHVDEKYVQGATLESLCHRKGSKEVVEVGKYGALSSDCDSPLALVNESYQFMKEEFDSQIDFIIDTGDVVRHDRDEEVPRTKDDVLSDHIRVVNYYNQYFDLSKIKVIPTIGNNDEYKHDKFEVNSKLLKKLVDIWGPYNLNLKGNEDFLSGGYFKVNIIKDKLDVISLNTLAWYNNNKGVKDCDKDGIAKDQLKWFKSQLKEAQTNGKSIYVIGHIPPNDKKGAPLYYPNCYSSYINLSGDYYKTIKAQFHGHTNSDTLAVLVKADSNLNKARNRDEAINSARKSKDSNYQLITLSKKQPELTLSSASILSVLTNGPSIIPANNPAVRLYTYSKKQDGLLLNFKQYYANLTQANLVGKLKFEIEYTSDLAYQLKDLSLESWQQFVPRLLDPKTGLYKLYSNFVEVSKLK